MVRLCSKSSRPYSGRPVALARRQRRARGPAMVPVGEQESAEAVVPRVTSREIPDGLTTREGLNLAGRTRPSVLLTRSDEADRLSIRAAITVAEKEWLLRPQGLPGTAVRGPACQACPAIASATADGVGAGRGNPPADPIGRPCFSSRRRHTRPQAASLQSEPRPGRPAWRVCAPD